MQLSSSGLDFLFSYQVVGTVNQDVVYHDIGSFELTLQLFKVDGSVDLVFFQGLSCGVKTQKYPHGNLDKYISTK